MILILIILSAAGIIAFRKRKRQQASQIYWDRINELEEQRKAEILQRALDTQRLMESK